jgi:hypothetical protein
MKGCNRKQYATSNVVLPGIWRVIVDSNTVSTPVINNIAVPLANTEVTFTFPTGTKRFELRLRNTARLQLSFVAGQSGTNYWTVNGGSVYGEDGINPATTLSIYVQTASAGSLLEIKSWS